MPRGPRRPAGSLSKAVAAILSTEVAAQGVSQRQLGEMVDISQGQISQYLRGERSLLIDEFEDISVALGFTATEVLDLAITLRASESQT